MKLSFYVCALGAVLSLGGCSKKSDDTPAGPADGLPDDPIPTAAGYDFSSMSQYLFADKWHTDAVVVWHQGKIVFEQYANGYRPRMRHIMYSASKSVGNALVGIAIGEGLMKREDSVCKYVPQAATSNAALCETTIDDLLHMSSGLKWAEEYESDPLTSNVIPMLYGHTPDMGAYVAARTRAAKAGTAWNYSSGDANLLALALKGALAGKDMRAYAKEKLFGPATIESAIFETDRAGTLVFSSSCFMTTRDMARFGEVYLEDGQLGGKRILPAGWVNYSKTPAASANTPKPAGGAYGAQFWLNSTSTSTDPTTFEYKDGPGDAYAAEGHWGQKIVIIPSEKLVVARAGNDRAPVFEMGPMVERAVAAVRAKK